MKKIVSKIWGIGLTFVLLASMLLAVAPTAPASAAELSWAAEAVPTATNYILALGYDTTDIAVAGDGATMYVATGNTSVFKTINGGASWTRILTSAGGLTAINADLIAVAPDNASMFAICDSTTPTGSVYVSTNGGTTFTALGTPVQTIPTPTSGFGAVPGSITDMAISAASAGTNYIAISGQDANGHANVWYESLAVGGVWTDAAVKSGFMVTTLTGFAKSTGTILEIAFSPSFASDLVMTAVSQNSSGTTLQMFSRSSSTWNSAAGFSTYPAAVLNNAGGAITDATRARIALAPTYLGADDTTRTVFIALGGGTYPGIYRMVDVTETVIKTGVSFYSIAFDGANLVAGTTTTTVWRCSDPLVTSPTFYASTATKNPGGVSNTVVAFAGINVVAVTSGLNSAFAVSNNYGQSFNDVSLIDAAFASLKDVTVSADGTALYWVTKNVSSGTGYTSIWAYTTSWQRVLSFSDGSDYIVRTSPTNAKVVYVAQIGGRNVYFSTDGGATKWFVRATRNNVTDFTVESDTIAYLASTSAVVSKSSNQGFTWSTAKATNLAGGDIATIVSISKDNLIAGGTTGYVVYSTDANSNWIVLTQKFTNTGTAAALQITATSLSTGGYIYASSATAASQVMRWTVGAPLTDLWKDLLAPTQASQGAYGIALKGGALYVATSNTTNAQVLRTLSPDITDPDASYWSTLDVGGTQYIPRAFNATPSSLKASSTTAGIKLWANNASTATGSDMSLYSYLDTMATVGPTLTGPADATKVQMNPISGASYVVSLTWSRPSKATRYDLWISFDKEFTQVAQKITVPTATTTTADATVSYIVGPGGTTNFSFMPGTTYYWRTRASADGPITSQWSSVRTFTILPGPANTPSIAAPVNGASGVSTSPAFSWTPVSGATQYEFQLSLNSLFSTTLASEKLAATGVRPVIQLDPGMVYFWRVRVSLPSVGDWSAVANFTVATPAPEPTPPVVVKEVPAPIINIPAPPPAQQIVIPPAPAPVQIVPAYIWAIVIIGAVLVIAVIVLIVRTRRTI